VIVDGIGDEHLLDSVVVILIQAFGRSRDAFQGPVLQGMAYVLANYSPDELNRDRLVRQLAELPVRQVRARAGGMREQHKGTLPRLVGAVIVDPSTTAAPAHAGRVVPDARPGRLASGGASRATPRPPRAPRLR
jgi:hypothetical protein